MREAIEKASIGYGVTYIAGILAGFPWGALASFLTCVWFAWLIGEKAWRKACTWFAARKAAASQ